MIVGAFLVILVCLATYRITRLIVRDLFPPVEKFREWVIRKFGASHWLSYLVTCYWCVSMYVGIVIVALTWWFYDLPYPLLVWPVASAVTGLISQREKIGLAEAMGR